MKYLFFILLSISIFAETEENSVTVYSQKVIEFTKSIDEIEKEIKKEDEMLGTLATNLINNDISTGSLVVSVENNDTNFFEIVEIKVLMNSKEIFNKSNSDASNFSVFSNSVDPGEYIFNFEIKLQGKGYKLFSYMNGYKYNIKKEVKVSVPVIGKSNLKFIIYKQESDDTNPEKLLGIKIDNQ